MKRLTLLLPLLLGALCPLFLAAKKDDSEAPKKIVFIAGNRSHASGDHEFNAGCHVLAKALNEQSGLNVEAVVLRADWHKKPEDKAKVAAADTIVIYCDGGKRHVAMDHREQLRARLAEGCGLVCLHYAVEMTPGE